MLRTLIEKAKREILEKEDSLGWSREKTNQILYKCWKEKYSKYFAQKTASKLIIQKIKKKIVDANFDIVTDTEALRYLLERELDKWKIRRIQYKTEFKKAVSLFFPYLYRVGEFRDTTYYKVDIKTCFFNIYSRLGVDSKIIADIHDKSIEIKAVARGLITSENSELIRILQNEKKLRNSVYGLTRCCFYTAFIPYCHIERRYFRTRLQNLDLTVIIASFLHHFVQKFRSHILYWNIDGGIIYPDCFEEMKKYLEELGFTLKKESEGEAIVLGLGSYKVGDYETLHFVNGVCTQEFQKEYLFNVKGAEKIEAWFKKNSRG